MPPEATKNTLPTLPARPEDPIEPAGGGTGTEAPAAPVEEDPSDGLGMTSADLYGAWQQGVVVLVDARLPDQFAAGHIPGAVNLPLEEFDDVYPSIAPRIDPALLSEQLVLVVYCDGGDCHASHNVASLLLELGYNEDYVIVYERGYESWIRAGYPVEKGGPAE